MLLVCPKCGDYYTDALPAFCLADGTPLVSLNPTSERWAEGCRVITEKEKALTARQRRLKWRRVLMTTMTTLITMMVVTVLAVNSLIYLKPKEAAPAEPPAQPTMPPLPVRADASAPSEPPVDPAPTLTPQVMVTPREEPSRTPVTTVTPRETQSPTPPHTTATVTTTPTVTVTTVTTQTLCSEADRTRERAAILRRFGGEWGQQLKLGILNVAAALGEPRYEVSFSKDCSEGFITVSLVRPEKVNGITQSTTIIPEHRFHCAKRNGVWTCSKVS